MADPDTDQLARVAERTGVQRLFDSAEVLIEDDSLDAVILATPDEQHSVQARMAMRRGRHLFVEKPLAATCQEAQQLQALAHDCGALLQVGMILRYEASHRWLRHQIQAGEFGDLVSIRAQRNCSRRSFAAIADHVHTVHRTLIHDIDLLLWFSGSQASRVMAMERRFGSHLSPEGCFALIQFACGCVGIAETSWFVPAQAPANVITDTWQGTIDAELAVVGTRRTAQLRLLDGPLQIWGEQRQHCPDGLLWPQRRGRVLGALQDELRDFVTTARSGIPSATASLRDAIEGLRIAEAIVESARSGQAVALMPP
jgi:predicted dehydrogenase